MLEDRVLKVKPSLQEITILSFITLKVQDQMGTAISAGGTDGDGLQNSASEWGVINYCSLDIVIRVAKNAIQDLHQRERERGIEIEIEMYLI